MTTVEMIKVYINQLCTQIGTSSEAVYSAEFNSWNFAKGAQNIEIFFTSYETSVKTVRTFIRCFSAIYPLPIEPQRQLDLFRIAMENNTQFMGVKMGTIPQKGFLYAVAERDIEGMDYEEFTTLIGDLGYWAERLSENLRSKIGVPQTSLN